MTTTTLIDLLHELATEIANLDSPENPVCQRGREAARELEIVTTTIGERYV